MLFDQQTRMSPSPWSVPAPLPKFRLARRMGNLLRLNDESSFLQSPTLQPSDLSSIAEDYLQLDNIATNVDMLTLSVRPCHVIKYGHSFKNMKDLKFFTRYYTWL